MGSAPKYNAIFVNLLGTVNFFHLRSHTLIWLLKNKNEETFLIVLFIYLFIYSFINWFSKSVGFDHSHGQFAAGDNEKNKRVVIFFFISMPKWQISCANMMTSRKTWNKSTSTKNGWLEVLELVALFLLKMGTFVARNWKEISVDAINVSLC